MTKSNYSYTNLKAALFSAVALFSIDQTKAENIDNFSFCLNTCKAPHCGDSTPSIKSDCKKRCGNEWKQVAKLELSRDNKEFRMLKDKDKKEAMLFESKIAKCLDEKVKETPAEKPLAPAADPKPGNNTNTITSKELCEAAIKQEMRALRNGQSELKIQESNMAAALEHLNGDVKKN